MRRSLINFFFISLLLTFWSMLDLQAQAGKPGDVIPPNPKVKIGKLSNGITYYIMENKKPEKRAELKIAFKAGSVLENDDQQGLAHFVEHMAFNGTKNFPKNDLISFLELTGVRFGADLNAYTSFDETVYMLQLPTDKPELMEKGIQVLEDWAHNVTFDDKEIDKERGVILEEWRLGKGAEDRVQKKHFPVILYNSQYAKRLPIGDTNVILHHKYETLKSFYHDWYRPDLMAVIAVGDFSAADVENLVKKHFGNIQPIANPRPRTEFDIPGHQNLLVSIASDKELSFPNVDITFKHKGRDERTYASYRQGIVERLFDGMLNNRLNELRIKPNPPFLFAQANEGRFLGETRAYSLFAGVKGDGIKQGLEALLTEAFRAMKTGFTQTEFDRIKQETLRDMEQAYAERDKTESMAFAEEFKRNFLDNEPMPGIETELGLYKKWVPEIKLDEVNGLSGKLITKENCVITVSAPEKPGVVIPTENDVVSIFNTVSSQNIAAYKDVVSDKPLFDKKLTEGKVVSEKAIKELGVTELTLSNGVKVVMKPTDFKNDEILLRAYSPGGTSLASDKDYVSAMLASTVVDQSGISEFDATMLQKMLTGKIANVSPMITNMTEGFNGQASPQDVETMFQLLNLYFTAPRRDNEAFESFMSRTIEQIKNSSMRPESAFRDTVSYALAKYHFRARPMTESTLKEVNLDKIYEFYKERFADVSDFTFFLVGNFTVDNIKPLITKYIGGLKPLNRKENWKDVGIRNSRGPLTKAVYKGIEPKSSVRLAINGDFEWTPQNRYDLTALKEVFNIKLREVLREDKGGVYGVGAGMNPTQFPKPEYSISIGFGCAPDRVDELITAVKDVIKQMRDSKPDETYINKVKEIQKREREVSIKKNEFWLGALYSYYFNNEDPRNILNYDKMVENLKAEDVHKAALKYFNMDNFESFVLYPENMDKSNK